MKKIYMNFVHIFFFFLYFQQHTPRLIILYSIIHNINIIMSDQKQQNPHLRYSEASPNVKNICKQYFNPKPFVNPFTKEIDCQSRQSFNVNQQGLFGGRFDNVSKAKSERNQMQENLSISKKNKETNGFKKVGLEKEKQFQKSPKSADVEKDFRSSTASQVIFKYSQSVRGNRKDSINKGKLINQNLNNFRKTFNSVQKIRIDKSLQNANGLKNLQNTLNYLQSRVNNAKNQLFKKKQKKINTSSDKNGVEKIKTQDFSIKNTKESEISDNSTGTVKKTGHLRISSLVAGQTKPKQLKYFDKNPYSPRKFNTYYVSQIVRAIHQKHSIAIQHISSSIRILKYIQNQQIQSFTDVEGRRLNLKKKECYRDKKTIVFDLDQTLIHCNQNSQMECDVRLPIQFSQTQFFLASVNIRPHALLMLSQLSKNFQLMIFTASQSSYANVVLDYLDPQKKLFQYRLFRQHCTETRKGMYIKDLRIINRNLSDIVLVDNSAFSYLFQLENGIPILPYYEGSIDFELKALTEYLNQLINVKDVRELNKKTFKLHHYTKFDNAQELIQQLYINA